MMIILLITFNILYFFLPGLFFYCGGKKFWICGNFYILDMGILYIITAVDLVIWPGLFFYETSYNNVIKCSYKVKKHNTTIKNIKKEKLTQQYSVSIQNSIKL